MSTSGAYCDMLLVNIVLCLLHHLCIYFFQKREHNVLDMVSQIFGYLHTDASSCSVSSSCSSLGTCLLFLMQLHEVRAEIDSLNVHLLDYEVNILLLLIVSKLF
jgi:hypothetical protein